jgi:hypothetical protein
VRVRAAIAALAATLLLAGTAGGASTRAVVLGISWQDAGKLAWLDARTLAPSGRSLAIGPPPTGIAARSPDGRTIALSSGIKAELRFVDTRDLRARGRLALEGTGSLRQAIWPRPDRLVAVRAGLDAELLVLDPRARRVLERVPLEGQPLSVLPSGKRLIFLLAPKEAIGQARLALADSEGAIRTLALPGVQAGFTPATREQEAGRQASPGLAVDPRGARAVVVTRDAVLDIDLETMAVVRRHSLAMRAPAGVSKLLEGWGRSAIWLRDGTVAVSGWTDVVEGERVVHAPTGVELVDVARGTRRSLDPSAWGATKAGSVLLSFGGSALRGYDLAGSLRFELLRGRDTGYVQTAGRWIYVGSDNSTRFTVVDARAGKVVGTARTPYPTIVLDNR